MVSSQRHSLHCWISIEDDHSLIDIAAAKPRFGGAFSKQLFEARTKAEVCNGPIVGPAATEIGGSDKINL